MDRITTRNEDGSIAIKNATLISEAFERLAKYEDMEESGQLLRIPPQGAVVYAISQPCGGCECFNKPMCEEFIERCQHCKKTAIIELEFSKDLLCELDTAVFFTREEAEKELRRIKS